MIIIIIIITVNFLEGRREWNQDKFANRQSITIQIGNKGKQINHNSEWKQR